MRDSKLGKLARLVWKSNVGRLFVTCPIDIDIQIKEVRQPVAIWLIRTIVRSFRSTYHKPLKIASFSVSRNLIRPWSCFSRYSHGLVTSEANISLFGFLELYRRYAPYIVFNTQQFVQYSRHSVKMANKILGMYQW